MLGQTLLASCLAAAGVQAAVARSEDMVRWRRDSAALDKQMEEVATRMAALDVLESRQTGTGTGAGSGTGMGTRTSLTRLGSNTPFKADGTIDLRAWDAMTREACIRSLRTVDHATNPAGVCVCYNLPVLNDQTGAFEAELRLFHLDPPTGSFTDIPQQDMQVALSYRGASVSPVAPEKAEQKSVFGRQAEVANAKANANANANTNATTTQSEDRIKQLKTYFFVGQLDGPRVAPGMGMDMAQVEAMTLPIITISAVNRTGQMVSTNVSPNEAAFVTGVYSQNVVLSDTAKAQLAVDAQVAGLHNGTVAFVLPGTRILIFPIGLIITATWTAVAAAVYGAGTLARINFRESYRRRAQRAAKGAVPTL